MATVGLNFGSATSGAGFDVTATVTSVLAIESAIEAPWKAQLATLQKQDAAFSSLGTNLSALSSALSALTNFDGVLAAKQGSSSDTGVLALTGASPAATAGSHTVLVSSLASTSSEYSDSFAGASSALSGTLSIQVGAGAAQTITLGATNDTLGALAQTINNGSYGVSASVVTDASGSRLSLVSGLSGAAGQITLGGALTDTTRNAAVGFHQGQPGADAQFSVEGLPTTSSSNTITGAIQGVTFQLLSSGTGTPVQIQITNDNSSVGTALQALVTSYNAAITSVKTQEGKDATGKAQPLFGDPTLALVQSQLASGLLLGSASGSFSSVTQLGLTVGQDGTLSLDTTRLNAALNSNYADVVGFFQNSASFGQSFAAALNGLSSSSPTGAIALAARQNASVESGITNNITAEDARIAAEKTTLTAELNLANEILQSIPGQLTQINEIYSAVTGYNQQK